jgi:fimbrial isopeptide formation D2 family protein/LPXTG-motif cell wall-anchored protein
MAASMLATGAAAATVQNATICTDYKASLTIRKYDMTAASLDGITTSPVATGYVDTTVETSYAPYAVRGVEFTYRKVADITTYTEVQKDGTSKIQIGYGIDPEDEILDILGLDRCDVIQEDMGTDDPERYYFASDTLMDALAELESRDMNTAKNRLEDYLRSEESVSLPETDATGTTSATGLDLGLYLVVETAVPEQITDTVAPFFVSLPMTSKDGDEWNYDVTVYPKNQSGMPTLEKLVAEVTTGALTAGDHTEQDDSYAPTATASDGDLLYYQITSKLPSIHSEATYLTTYTFVDTLSKGIAYHQGDVVLTWYTDEACTNEVASWTMDSGKFSVNYGTALNAATTMTITMTEAGLNEINPNYGDHYVRISYAATVNSSADVVYGEAGNPNDVTLTWQRSNMDYFDQLKDQCIVYTFGIDLTKVFSGGAGNFGEVSFKIKNTSDNYYLTAVRGADGVYYVQGEECKTANEADATIFVPNSDTGTLLIYGLEDDTYEITEVATDDGYTLLKNSISVVISTETSDVIFQQNGDACADGAASGVAYDGYMQTSLNAACTASATVDGKAVSMEEVEASIHALVPLTVVNSRGFDLPQTGGAGSMLLIVGGMVAVTVAGVAVCKMMKKKDAE